MIKMIRSRIPGPSATVHRWCRAVLTRAVRGGRQRGPNWGEAVLAELSEIDGAAAALRWTVGGVRIALRERRRAARPQARSSAEVRQSASQVALRLAAICAGLVSLTFLVNQFVVTTGYIPSGAMEPTLEIGDRIVVDRISPRFTGLRRGDVVVFNSIGHNGAPITMIKRVVALPGDRVECRDGRLLRNGSPADEPYLGMESRTECAAVDVPQGTVYLLGDHRMVSLDSREFGPVPRSALVGRVLAAGWPPRGVG